MGPSLYGWKPVRHKGAIVGYIEDQAMRDVECPRAVFGAHCGAIARVRTEREAREHLIEHAKRQRHDP